MAMSSESDQTMATSWATALSLTAEILNRNGLDWMLVGSGATALRGAAIEPGDIDIAVSSPKDVALAAELMPTPDIQVPQEVTPAWISTRSAPTLTLGTPSDQWTFGRWIIDGFRVEVAHIDSPGTATQYLETRSPLSWHQREFLYCNGHTIPTVPIEPQLATMMARQQTGRIEATLAAIDPEALNRQRLRQAIEDKRTDAPDLTVPTGIQRLINN